MVKIKAKDRDNYVIEVSVEKAKRITDHSPHLWELVKEKKSIKKDKEE